MNLALKQIRAEALNKFVTTNATTGKPEAVETFEATSIPFTSLVGLTSTNVRDAIDEAVSALPGTITTLINIGPGIYIKQSTGNSRINLRYGNVDSTVGITNAALGAKTLSYVHLEVAQNTIGFNLTTSYSQYSNTVLKQVAPKYTSYVLAATGEIFMAAPTTAAFTSTNATSGAGVIINSRNSTYNINIVRSVILGGTGLTATADDGVYVPNLIIGNGYFITGVNPALTKFNFGAGGASLTVTSDGGTGASTKFSIDGTTAMYGHATAYLTATANNITLRASTASGTVDLKGALGVRLSVDSYLTYAIEIYKNSGGTVTTSNATRPPVFISSQNSALNTGVVNTVIAGGQDIIGKTSGALYTSLLAIANSGYEILISPPTLSADLAFTLPSVSGTLMLATVGTVNQIAKFTGVGAIGNSLISDNGTYIGLNTTTYVNTVNIAGEILSLSNTVTKTASTAEYGAWFERKYTASATLLEAATVCLINAAPIANNSTTTYCGTINSGFYTSSFNLTNASKVQLRGSNNNITITSAATIASAAMAQNQVSLTNVGAVITTLFGNRVSIDADNTTGGTITNWYSFYMENLTGTPATITNRWGVYINDPLAKNYFSNVVGIGTNTPVSSSLLDISSTTLGVVFPRMTTVQKTAIVSPVAGLEVYDTTLNLKSYYNGTTWQTIVPASRTVTATGSGITGGGDLTANRTISLDFAYLDTVYAPYLNYYVEVGADATIDLGAGIGIITFYTNTQADYIQIDPSNGIYIVTSGVNEYSVTAGGAVAITAGGGDMTLGASGNILLGTTAMILGNKAADPAGTNGMIYYNNVTNKFRGYENGAWVNLV